MPASVSHPVIEPDELLFPSELEMDHGNGSGGGPGDFDPGDRGGGGGGDDDGEEDSPPGIYRISLWATLSAVLTLFIVLAIAYVVRSTNPRFWEPIVLPPILWASTGVLLVSSLTCEAGRIAMARGRDRAYGAWLLVTGGLGGVFIALQVIAWKQLAAGGVFLNENPHSSFFYLFTAAHGLHLLGGIVVVVFLGLRSLRPTHRQRLSVRQEIAGVATIYWHFMGALWCLLFVLLILRG
jgi:cytochrome c oxidase subunit 3